MFGHNVSNEKRPHQLIGKVSQTTIVASIAEDLNPVLTTFTV